LLIARAIAAARKLGKPIDINPDVAVATTLRVADAEATLVTHESLR
jgi:hypothetical protein